MIERAPIKSTEKRAPEAKKNQTHEQDGSDDPASSDGGSEAFRHSNAETLHHSDPPDGWCGGGQAKISKKRRIPVVATRFGNPAGPQAAARPDPWPRADTVRVESPEEEHIAGGGPVRERYDGNVSAHRCHGAAEQSKDKFVDFLQHVPTSAGARCS
jgi:hypothetical protein